MQRVIDAVHPYPALGEINKKVATRSSPQDFFRKGEEGIEIFLCP
jgi:hypothetical protein